MEYTLHYPPPVCKIIGMGKKLGPPPSTMTTLIEGKTVLPPIDRPAQMALILTLLSGGHYLQTALRAAGVSSTSYRYWMEQGQNALYKPEGERTDNEKQYIEFAISVKAIDAVAEEAAVAAIRSAMPRDWRAAAFFLERRFPDRWRMRTEAADVTDDELNNAIRGELARLVPREETSLPPASKADPDGSPPIDSV